MNYERKERKKQCSKPVKIIKRIILVILTLILLYLLTILSIAISAIVMSGNEYENWAKWQDNHIKQLQSEYANGSAARINEQDFCNFDLNRAISNGTKINELGYLATHNSYKTGLNKGSEILYHYVVPKIAGHKYDYCFETITNQFNSGLRSVELDLNYIQNKDGYEISFVHNLLLETNSTMINAKKGLTEIKMWSDYNPNHLPLIIMIEAKNGLMLTKAKDMTSEYYKNFDNLIKEVFGDKLITPASMLGGCADFNEFRATNNYPTISESLGKIMFVLQDEKNMQEYINVDTTLKSQAMFPLAHMREFKENKDLKKYTCFAISNNPNNLEEISSLITDYNCMVRTRLDEYLSHSDENYKNGIASGANIMSSDYPPRVDKKIVDDYLCTLRNGKTIDLRSNK